MATFTETIDDLYVSTWEESRKETVDIIYDQSALYYWFKKKGRMFEDFTGAEVLRVPLLVAKNDTVATFGKGDSFPTTRSDVLDIAKYEWKYVGGSLIRYKVDEDINAGKARIINMVQMDIDNLRLSLVDKMETMLFADGSGNSGLDWNGLDIICDEDPTTAVTSPQEEVGGIAQADNTNWRNVYRQMDSDGTVASLHMMKSWKYVMKECKNGSDRPDIIVTTDTILDYYDDEALEIKSIQNTMLADAGFDTWTWRGLPIVTSASCKSGSAYFLNTKYLKMITKGGSNFTMTPWKEKYDTLDRYAQVFAAGNFITTNRKRQGVVFDID